MSVAAGHCAICGTTFMLGENIVSNGDGYDVHEKCNKCSRCAGPLGSSVYAREKENGLLEVVCIECGLASAQGAKA